MTHNRAIWDNDYKDKEQGTRNKEQEGSMSELVASTKSQIKWIVPYPKDIFIKIKRAHDLYRLKIHVKITGTILHAEKKAQTVWESVELSYHAILKQIDRIKAKRQKRHAPRVWKWQAPHIPPPRRWKREKDTLKPTESIMF